MPVRSITPTLDSMHVAVPSALRRIERISLEHGVAYPWWMPVTCKSGQAIATIVAFSQRDRLTSWQLLAVLALLAIPLTLEFRSGRWASAWLRAIPYLLAFAAIELIPLPPSTTLDAAVLVLALIVADFTARDGWRGGLVFLAAAVVPLVAWTQQSDLMLSLLFLAVGFEGGFMVHWSARALAAERQARAEAYERATLAERDRIAREIHDLVAHSLSVTMLQVTAARRMVDAGDDPTEIVSALEDAERVGRRAMSDIRQTVSGMSTSQPRRPLPSVDDLPTLIADIRSAGQPVEFTIAGDISSLPAPVGLGLYRVAQESLANVAKHAGGATAEISLDVTAHQARLTVRNLVVVPQQGDGMGSGLAGMRARIDQLGGRLTAGRAAGAWVVQAVVPLKGGDRLSARQSTAVSAP
jgi:signal transduction histidine kinase